MLAALVSLAINVMPFDDSSRARPREAAPALYAVRDCDTTIYIFGTFHVLDPSIRWFGGTLAAAFGRSPELVVETLPPELDQPALTARPAAIGTAIPAASFLASSQAAVHAGREQGMELQNGADMVLLRNATAQHKAIEPLETLQSQFAMLARLPAAGSSASSATKDSAQASNQHRGLLTALENLQAAWAAGDQGMFAAMLGDMRSASPAAYRSMFVERNARWTDWIAARMRQPGTVFVAVGAAHLAGPDSLLVRLAQRGFISRRVNKSD